MLDEISGLLPHKELVDEFNFISLGCSLISDPYEDFAKDTFIGIEIAKEIGPGKRVVTLNCDNGLKYLGSHIYS